MDVPQFIHLPTEGYLSVWLVCVLVCSSLGFSCLGLSGLPGLGWLFPFPCSGSFQLLSLQIFSHSLSFSHLLLDSYNSNIGAFDIVPEVSETLLSSFYFIHFTLFCSSEVTSTILSSSSMIHSSASDILLLIPSRVFLISVTVLFVSVCLFFNSFFYFKFLFLLYFTSQYCIGFGIHWHESPVYVRCRMQDAWGWCTGMIWRDDVGWEVGGGFMLGSSCTPLADSCQCMPKPIQYCKVK